MSKPTVSIYELGNALGTVAGMEYAEMLTAPVEGAKFRIAGLFDSASVESVKNYLRDLDGSIESFKMDAQKNVTREAFLQSLNGWLFGWKKFYGDHLTTTQILLAGQDATMTEGKEYGQKLEGYRKAYLLETGKQPEGQTPTPPKDDEKPGVFSVSLTTKILLVLGAATVLGVVGYMTYRYVKKAKEDIGHAERLTRGYAERLLLHGGSGSTSGQGHAIVGAGE